MLEIFGPTYKYQGEILSEPEIIFIEDHHYDEQNHCFQVQQLLENSACDPRLHLIIVGGLGHDDVLDQYRCVSLPYFTAGTCEQFNRGNIIPDWTQKTHCFNFMINKPRLHRRFLLMLLQHFELDNYTYCLPWKNLDLNPRELMGRTSNAEYQSIITQNPKFNRSGTNYAFGNEATLDQGIKNGSWKNAQTYNQFLKSQVFEPSCVSLITGSLFYERETRISETTLMAMYAGTIPIWVGGWRAAQRLKDLGFDVFDDLVDHSYQDMPDPMDRCYFAIKNNLKILQDFEGTKKFVDQNHARLQKNLDLCKNNVFLKHIGDQVSKLPGNLQPIVKTFVNQQVMGLT
jgi:hypothetical protein